MKAILVIILVGFGTSAFGQNEKGSVIKGNQLYKKQAFDKASEEYQRAATANQKSPEAQYNLGNAYYKTKKQSQAIEAFEAAAENSTDKTFKSRANYNRGVVYSNQKQLPESISAYKDALKLNPNDKEARENLQKALNELKKQQQQQQQQQNKQDKKQQNNQQDQQKQNNSKLNEKQAERMLNALRQEEKKLQQNIQNKKTATGGMQSKDW